MDKSGWNVVQWTTNKPGVAHCCTCFIETVHDDWKIIANKKSEEMNRITNLISSAKKQKRKLT